MAMNISELERTLIPVDDRYALGADTRSWYIAKKKLKRGIYHWEPFQWHSSLDKAGQALFDLKVRTCGAKDYTHLLRAVTASRNDILRALHNASSLWPRYDG